MEPPLIVVAVDDDDLQELKRILSAAGYVVIGVSDAESAAYILETVAEADLVITEFPTLRMGGGTMVELLCGGRAPSQCRTLALIRDYRSGLAAAAAAEGFTEVYARPVVPATLLPVVERLLRPPPGTPE